MYIRVAKTKALTSFAVTAKLICAFVFAYAKSRFSQDAAHMRVSMIERGRGGLVVESLTPEREVGGSIPTSVE